MSLLWLSPVSGEWQLKAAADSVQSPSLLCPYHLRSLPPSHPNSVTKSTLHAILAAAAPFSPYCQDIESSFFVPESSAPNTISNPVLAGIGRFAGPLPTRVGIQFGEYHISRARSEVEEDLLRGSESRGKPTNQDFLKKVNRLTLLLSPFFSNSFELPPCRGTH